MTALRVIPSRRSPASKRRDLVGPNRLHRLPGFLLAALALAVPAAAAEKEVPFLSGRVVDEAGIVPPEARARIEQKLVAYEAETGHQVAVLTVPSLEGEAIDDYSLRVAEAWQLGREGVDDGVLFLVAPEDRRMRIEVGYGLEPVLTDLESSVILDSIVAPKFRAGDYGGGIEAGVDAIVASLRGEEVGPPPGAGDGMPVEDMPWYARGLVTLFVLFVLFPFSTAALGGKGCSGWFLYLFLIPFWGIFPGALIHPYAGVALAGLWILGVPLVRWWARSHDLPKWLAGTGKGGWAWTGGGRGGGGFSGGGGGFSGGGGSFGGGGASGSW